MGRSTRVSEFVSFFITRNVDVTGNTNKADTNASGFARDDGIDNATEGAILSDDLELP